MNLFLKLSYVFFRIGLLTVGGGLAMIPIVQYEMVSRGWLDNQQFLDILGIAQMTPGPISVNTATFVGYRVIAGVFPHLPGYAFLGAAVATLSVCLPSLLCINLFGGFWSRNRDHRGMIRVFTVLRPLVTGLVITAAILLALNALWGEHFAAVLTQWPDWRLVLIVLAVFGCTAFTKISPVLLLLGAAILGWIMRLPV